MKNVLVVDDSSFMRSRMTNILEALQYNVVAEAENGEEAIKMFHEIDEIDLVMLDINMPGMSGKDVLQELKKHRETVQVVMCSSIGHDHIIHQCIKKGAAAYIIKPYTESLVKEILNEIMICR